MLLQSIIRASFHTSADVSVIALCPLLTNMCMCHVLLGHALLQATERFFRLATEVVVEACFKSARMPAPPDSKESECLV